MIEPTEPLPSPEPDPIQQHLRTWRDILVLIAQQVADLTRKLEELIVEPAPMPPEPPPE